MLHHNWESIAFDSGRNPWGTIDDDVGRKSGFIWQLAYNT